MNDIRVLIKLTRHIFDGEVTENISNYSSIIKLGRMSKRFFNLTGKSIESKKRTFQQRQQYRILLTLVIFAIQHIE